MHADLECFLFNLWCFNIVFKMYPTLIFIVLIGLIELQVFPSVVNLPVSFKSTRLFQFFFKITENIFYVFHAVMKEFKKNWIFQVGQHQLVQNQKEVIPISIFAGFEK